jgi:LacI family transcriptional regulator
MNRRTRTRRWKMSDVAEAAGVSLATVDRALNGRGVVRQETLELVLKAAGELGYIAPIAPIADVGPFRFDVVLPGGSNTFLRILAAEIEAAAGARQADLSISIHRVEDFQPHILTQTLNAIDLSDGVAVIAPDHPSVREALRSLKGRGIPVATIITDVANVGRIGYVGIDNRAAGRLAGQLLGQLLGGRKGGVLLFLGSRSYRGHEEREIGFRDLISEDYPHLEVIDVRDVRDNVEQARSETARFLASRSDIVGIYNIAAGNRGITAALETVRRKPKIAFVAHELTEHTRRSLISGILDVAIDQNPRLEAAEIVQLLHAQASGSPLPLLEAPRITPFFRENLP